MPATPSNISSTTCAPASVVLIGNVMTKIEVLFSPAEFEALPKRDLSATTCVVFDVLRATSSIVTALAHGAESITPVATIAEALQEKQKNPEILLAGERDGFRITSKLTSTIDFDLGNSPREFLHPSIGDRKSTRLNSSHGY